MGIRLVRFELKEEKLEQKGEFNCVFLCYFKNQD